MNKFFIVSVLLSAILPNYVIKCSSQQQYYPSTDRLQSKVEHLDKQVNMLNSKYSRFLKYPDYWDMDLRTPCGYSADDLNSLLRNTRLNGLGGEFYTSEKVYHVNALFLIAVAYEESGLGTSNEAISKHNLFGFCSYDNSSGSATAFNSYGSCISSVAENLSENYLNNDGCFFRGYTVRAVNENYCTNKYWSQDVVLIMSGLNSLLQSHKSI
jgi:beta-N-acetylglucosaminidase